MDLKSNTMAKLLDELKGLKGLVNTKKHSDMKSQNLLIGALAGLVAGVAIGLLMAPASGSETRQKIADGASGLTDNLKKRYRKLAGKEEMENDSDPWATQNSARNGASASPNWNG
jgi:gas vesicle protein